MNKLIIEHFEKTIKLLGYDDAGMIIISNYEKYEEIIKQEIRNGYLYQLHKNTYKLTEEGKDFMRIIML